MKIVNIFKGFIELLLVKPAVASAIDKYLKIDKKVAPKRVTIQKLSNRVFLILISGTNIILTIKEIIVIKIIY